LQGIQPHRLTSMQCVFQLGGNFLSADHGGGVK
jgi:hypothetical protein